MRIVWRISWGISACFYIYYAIVTARYWLGFTTELHVDTMWAFLAFASTAIVALERTFEDPS